MFETSDEELMIRIADGDGKAFEVLFLRHRSKVFGYLLSKANDRGLAEDLLQETFERVYLKAHLFDPSSTFLPWVFTISRNVLIDKFRKLKRDKDLEGEFSQKELHLSPTSEVSLEDLPLKYKEALHLRYYEDKDFEEISREMKVSPSNARQLISRGIRILKKKWEK